MQKADSNSSAGTVADSSTKDENLSVSSHDTKPNVSGLPLSNPELKSKWIVKCFKWGYRNGWEMNVRMGKFCLRIARHQFAFWKRNDPVFNLLY